MKKFREEPISLLSGASVMTGSSWMRDQNKYGELEREMATTTVFCSHLQNQMDNYKQENWSQNYWKRL